METKTLRLEGTPGKLESQYVVNMTVPGKTDLLSMIEKPPFHIFSKDDSTFSTGILSYTPHSIKVRISRDYQEPFVGLYIRITPKSEEIVDISEVRGAFMVNTAKGSVSAAANSKRTIRPIPQLQPTSQSSNSLSANENEYNAHNNNNNNSGTVNNNNSSHNEENCQQIVSFNFFKNSVSKLLDLENYNYYESRCQWPEDASQLNLFVKVTKTTYSFLVTEENCASCDLQDSRKQGVQSSAYFLSDTFSDVNIHVGEAIYPAHKIILSERSRYFSRMFASSMRESNEGIVRITDEDESVFKELLRFIYQGTVENLEENASELFILSDKYDIPELATYCEKHLLSKLTMDNAIEMFDLSQSIVVQGMLAKKSKELIMWNRDKFSADLETFKVFSRKYPEIVFELLQLK